MTGGHEQNRHSVHRHGEQQHFSNLRLPPDYISFHCCFHRITRGLAKLSGDRLG